MEKMIFTFENPQTFERRSTLAANEMIARMSLGGIWDDPERTTAWPPCEVAQLPALIEQALEEEKAAHEARQALNPIGKTNYTTPEVLAEFSALHEKFEKRKAHRRELQQLAL